MARTQYFGIVTYTSVVRNTTLRCPSPVQLAQPGQVHLGLQNSKRNYYTNQLGKAKGDVKNMWKMINSIIHNKQQSKINTIDIESAIVNSPLLLTTLIIIS